MVDPSGDTALMLQNLEKIFDGIKEFFEMKCSSTVDDNEIDLESIAQRGDESELTQLVEHVLGISVQCEDKEDYIAHILNLDEDIQNDLMNVIEKCLNRFG